jgi:hypothetical protein
MVRGRETMCSLGDLLNLTSSRGLDMGCLNRTPGDGVMNLTLSKYKR